MHFKATFERQCFAYQPSIKQMAEVAFEFPEEPNDDNAKEFNEAAWEAMREQAGWNDQQKTPHGGFCSIFLEKCEKVIVPHEDREIERPAPGKPVIACSIKVKGDGNSYRVTGFYKFEWYVPPADTKKPRWRVVRCLAKDAQVVSGYGVCGVQAILEDIKVGDLVGWSDLMIRQEQGKYANDVAKQTEDDIWHFNWSFDQEWRDRLVKKLGLVAPE